MIFLLSVYGQFETCQITFQRMKKFLQMVLSQKLPKFSHKLRGLVL